MVRGHAGVQWCLDRLFAAQPAADAVILLLHQAQWLLQVSCAVHKL